MRFLMRILNYCLYLHRRLQDRDLIAGANVIYQKRKQA